MMKILLATDGSPSATFAGNLLACMPLPPGSELTLLTVVDKLDMLPALEEMVSDGERQARQQWQQTRHREAEQLLAREQARFTEMGWTVRTDIREGHAAHQIVQMATELKADLVVVGSRGLGGLRRLVLGSVSQQVMTYAPCSVLIAKGQHDNDGNTADPAIQPFDRDAVPWRLLVAYDGSPTAEAAIETLAALPLGDRTELLITTVFPLITAYRADLIHIMNASWQEKRRASQARLDHITQGLRQATPHVTTTLRQGEDPGQEILAAARAFGATLIVMGHQGRSGIDRFLILDDQVFSACNFSIVDF
jgi:nucleotide-binding universal stress UspA family protein